MVCKKAPGKLARYRVLNDIIWRAFSAAGIPAVKMENDDDDEDDDDDDDIGYVGLFLSRRKMVG